jgi:NADP-dependent 3-hydroxy acid dehydrogenase YdfG
MITIINGGTQGLGAAVARRLVATGFTDGLLLAGRSADRGDQLAEELNAAGVKTTSKPPTFLSRLRREK